jgi:hypothetical protein
MACAVTQSSTLLFRTEAVGLSPLIRSGREAGYLFIVDASTVEPRSFHRAQSIRQSQSTSSFPGCLASFFQEDRQVLFRRPTYFM